MLDLGTRLKRNTERMRRVLLTQPSEEGGCIVLSTGDAYS
jgi:hypothetical protein